MALTFTKSITKNGKIINDQKFTFKDKDEFKQYVDISESIWGCVPIQVDWAQNTRIYQNAKAKYRTLDT